MDKKFFNIFFATIIFACAFFVPEISQAYGNDPVKCFSWNDCYKNDPACNGRTLICDDDKPGYNVYCKITTNPTQRCSMDESAGVVRGCGYQIIEECGYYKVAAPKVDLLVNNSNGPVTISAGESATLSWDAKDSSSPSHPNRYHLTCEASEAWSGKKNTSGSEVVKPNQTSEYKITCTNDGSSVSDQVTVIVVGSGQGTVTPTPPTTSTPAPTIVPARGNLSVKARMNGVEMNTPVSVQYQFFGPQTLNGSSAPQLFNDIDANSANSYTGKFISGGPEKSTFLGFSPSQSIHVTPGQTTTVYLDFTDGAGLCNITVQAVKTSCDGSNQYPWTGPLSYGLLGPAILSGMTVNQTFETIPAGRYYFTSLMGGPGIYNGVTPGNPVSCPSGGNVTLTMKFRDCGETKL